MDNKNKTILSGKEFNSNLSMFNSEGFNVLLMSFDYERERITKELKELNIIKDSNVA